jgi:hypothetical protein
MTLPQIFKTKPELLEEKEVKDLIMYAKDMHKQTAAIAKKYQDFHDEVLDLCIHSEVVLIDGNEAKEVVKDILTHLNKI